MEVLCKDLAKRSGTETLHRDRDLLQTSCMKVSDWVGLFTGSGVVCARQKWVVCARQKLVVCARYFCVILSLYLCNMILLYIITRLITVWGFPHITVWGFCF